LTKPSRKGPILSLPQETAIALGTLRDRATGLFDPTVRLGVTGLARAGKTVFITALVHNLLHNGRLPFFRAQQSGRISRAYLAPQPDDSVPRFQYEDHVAALLEERQWPQSTRAVSELRLTIDYETASGWNRLFSPGRLSVDIIDYPGEWLLDLPLLSMTFADFSQQAVDLVKSPPRRELAREWLEHARTIQPSDPADETVARALAARYSAYLHACKADEKALSTLPPGRFLMPGDLEGSPALTFSPLVGDLEKHADKGSLQAMMERRFESYKALVVRPFFRDHFARLDRQIVLIDTLQALNAGAEAVIDLERALQAILECFRPGRTNFLSGLVSRRIDRVLIAATKADHLHHESHERLERLVEKLVARACQRIGSSGADMSVLALAAIRSTREGTAMKDGEELPVIMGTPIAGEKIGDKTFDGKTKTAIFPGDLPENPDSVFKLVESQSEHPESIRQGSLIPDLRFVRFRPPLLERTSDGLRLSLPHIRLDRALEFLIGDYLE